MPEDADTALMLRLRDGEDIVLNELMTRWQQPLVSFIYRYIGNQTEALDLAQETFVRVFESRHRYKASAKFSTWLFTIASNLCRNYFRWKQRHPTAELSATNGELDEAAESLAFDSDSPAEIAQRSETAAAVRAEVQKLPHDLKTALLLFEFEELSYKEISEVLGCSAKAVETRIYRARNLLRVALDTSNSLIA